MEVCRVDRRPVEQSRRANTEPSIATSDTFTLVYDFWVTDGVGEAVDSLPSTNLIGTLVLLLSFRRFPYSSQVAHRSVCSIGERLSNSGPAESYRFGAVS
jgi:hypothetical protein